ncbi:hypothetical protein M5D96_002318, partial [Drosophila gunungcola]
LRFFTYLYFYFARLSFPSENIHIQACVCVICQDGGHHIQTSIHTHTHALYRVYRTFAKIYNTARGLNRLYFLLNRYH